MGLRGPVASCGMAMTIAFAFAAVVNGATFTWQVPSGDWSVASNWGGTGAQLFSDDHYCQWRYRQHYAARSYRPNLYLADERFR